MKRNRFDVSSVVQDFSNNRVPDRNDLVYFFRQEVTFNPNLRPLLAEILQSAAEHKLDPQSVLALGMMYGMALGVLMERRREESRIVIPV